MSVEAEIPAVWECPRCGAEALSKHDEPRRRRPRSRSAPTGTCSGASLGQELEEILAERLELLRGGEIGPAHLHRPAKKKAKTA